ncbi:MAG: PorV/PorQ family protein, partial [Candidatus Firestonebacteria bacterium]|nr:PorV/PorQ family protein [Candidatus Firestonebacteria bacterium]
LVIITLLVCFAGEYLTAAGTASGVFLRLGAGARISGMGEAGVAAVEDATAVYWNPAGLNYVKTGSVSLMHGLWFEGMSYDWVGVALDLKDAGKIGLGAQLFTYGNLIGMDDTGLSNGDFSPSDLAVTAAYGLDADGIKIGFSVKYIMLQIKQSATAFALDIGAMKQFETEKGFLRAAVSASNIGSGIKFVSDEFPLPVCLKAGVAFSPDKQLLGALDIVLPSDGAVYFALGVEYPVKLAANINIAVRGGYNTRMAQLSFLNGLTAGAGIKFDSYSLDYAFGNYGEDLGYTHKISLSLEFGEKETAVIEKRKFSTEKKYNMESENSISEPKAVIKPAKEAEAAAPIKVEPKEESVKETPKGIAQTTLEKKNVTSEGSFVTAVPVKTAEVSEIAKQKIEEPKSSLDEISERTKNVLAKTVPVKKKRLLVKKITNADGSVTRITIRSDVTPELAPIPAGNTTPAVR